MIIQPQCYAVNTQGKVSNSNNYSELTQNLMWTEALAPSSHSQQKKHCLVYIFELRIWIKIHRWENGESNDDYGDLIFLSVFVAWPNRHWGDWMSFVLPAVLLPFCESIFKFKIGEALLDPTSYIIIILYHQRSFLMLWQLPSKWHHHLVQTDVCAKIYFLE